MALGGVSEQTRVWRLVAAHAWQNTLRWFHGATPFGYSPLSGTPQRLLIAPQNLRTADPTIAADIYAGRFVFSGHQAESAGRSPFEIDAPDPDWARALHGFGWLRHLRAAKTNMARANARALVDDWIRICGRRHSIGWEQAVVARRILSWLSQSPLLLEDCDREFYNRFLRALIRQVRYLRKTINETPDGVPRMVASLALAAAAVSMSGQGRFARQSLRRLDLELKRQILPDGGHISRNPGAILDILVDLLPVRQAFVMQGLAPSGTVMTSVDRMMPMIRFFRHGDGSFAHFNGMGATPGDLVATVLAYDDARGSPPNNASHSGYQRMVGEETVVLMDTGCPPPPMVSQHAHAGCLSMEVSSRANRLVVNCGVSSHGKDTWRRVARSTAAHSTAEFEDTSSCRFMTGGSLVRKLGALIVGGPTDVPVHREDLSDGTSVSASHNGYAKIFKLLHEREVRLSADGTLIDGVDRFVSLRGAPSGEKDRYAVRFHLHPLVKASLLRGGGAVLLMCADGEAWEFSGADVEIALEESIYLSDVHGHRRTEQIVLYDRLRHAREVHWHFRRTASAKPARRRPPESDEAMLPI
ncbi:heparinase II/III family protein [Breoghania sp. L-A4]|uniref:heparinase II/III family protein n=1 Tax=Breoghania sp. L-A4 TaxID=2304600 RepID=UPI000E35A865|nr:heparinase II/III family protein [Breoghania sp. L-A4]AXS42317.1 heparinase [Breoghania sp. L-A4]